MTSYTFVNMNTAVE